MLVLRKQGLFPPLITIIGRQVAGQEGATGAQLGHPRLPRRTALLPRQVELSPREVILPPNNSRVYISQGSSMKNLTLSGPLTCPANLCGSPRHPPNLEYITAIETVCTKLSQRDAEELRADIN